MCKQPGEQRPLPQRKHPAHPSPVFSGERPIVIHVTVCTKQRRPILASAENHTALKSAWLDATNWRVGVYMIIPDHLHLFCTPGVPDPEPLRKWVQRWKGHVSRNSPTLRKAWQGDCWDTQMRTAGQYVEKLSYVRLNPVRRQLVAHPEAWPFQGELYVIEW